MKKILPLSILRKVAALVAFVTINNLGVEAQVSNVQCNSNGTLSVASDDYISFSLQPTLPVAEYVAPYTYRVTATQNGNPVVVKLSNDSAATNVMYFHNYAMPFKLQAGTPGNGPIQLTVTPNWGSFTPTVYTVVNPGSCAISTCTGATNQTVTYTYEHPRMVADIFDGLAGIPKFDNANGRLLTGVSVTLTPLAWSGTVMENGAAQNQNFRYRISSDYNFSLGGSNISTQPSVTMNTSAGYPALAFVGAKKYVPASATWSGDSIRAEVGVSGQPGYISPDTSTLLRMSSWLGNAQLRGLPYTSDSRWAPNASGVATATSDFAIMPVTHTQTNTTFNYTSANSQFANFVGTGNKVPFEFDSFTSYTITGGGGNFKWSMTTTVAFKISVTYTYTDCPEGGPLPVKLENFTAVPKGKTVQTQWKVADMINFSHFEVEHSTNGSSFANIGNVAATTALQYALSHSSPVAGNNFYRLKMVDMDGRFKYSPTEKVVYKEAGSVQITPNPAVDFVSIQFNSAEAGKGTATWYNAAGQQVASQQLIQGENKNINISTLKSGIYIVHIIDAKGNKISIEKVMVQ